MDRCFYSVELNEDRKKVVHVSGNVYWNDADAEKTDYRIAEWTFFYITIDELKELIKDGRFYDYVNERVNYLGDISKAEALKMCNQYFGGNPGICLHICDVNEETPCGDYWFERSESYD